MTSEIPDVGVLRNLVDRAIGLESVSETSDIWRVYDRTEDEDVKGLLFDMKVQSEHHLHSLMDVAREIGMDVDLEELERRRERDRLIREGMDLVDVLEQLRMHDRNCKDFYERVASALRRSDIEGVDEDSIADEFEALAGYEEVHIERMEERINRLQSPL